MNVIEHLIEAVEAYRTVYGEPEYRHFKKLVVWTNGRRGAGYHTSPIGDGQEVSLEEYESNITTSECEQREAFMGRLPRNYWQYHRKIATDGWREHLLRDLTAVAVSNGVRQMNERRE